MAESISEGTLKTWLKQPGDTVQADEEVATIETDKVRFACPRFVPFLSLVSLFLSPRVLESSLALATRCGRALGPVMTRSA